MSKDARQIVEYFAGMLCEWRGYHKALPRTRAFQLNGRDQTGTKHYLVRGECRCSAAFGVDRPCDADGFLPSPLEKWSDDEATFADGSVMALDGSRSVRSTKDTIAKPMIAQAAESRITQRK